MATSPYPQELYTALKANRIEAETTGSQKSVDDYFALRSKYGEQAVIDAEQQLRQDAYVAAQPKQAALQNTSKQATEAWLQKESEVAMAKKALYGASLDKIYAKYGGFQPMADDRQKQMAIISSPNSTPDQIAQAKSTLAGIDELAAGVGESLQGYTSPTGGTFAPYTPSVVDPELAKLQQARDYAQNAAYLDTSATQTPYSYAWGAAKSPSDQLNSWVTEQQQLIKKLQQYDTNPSNDPFASSYRDSNWSRLNFLNTNIGNVDPSKVVNYNPSKTGGSVFTDVNGKPIITSGIKNIDSLLADQQRTLTFLNQNSNNPSQATQVATAKSFLDSINNDISKSDPSKVKTFTGTSTGTGGTSALGTGNISALGTGSISALGTGGTSALGTGSISALGTGGTSALGTGSISALGTGSIPALTTADLAAWGKTLPQGLTSDQLTSALNTQQTALTKQNEDFLKNWNTSADALKNSILTGVDTKNQQFGTQATQGFMDAFKNFQIPTNQQTGVNLGNYNDNRNAAADQWWSQYVTGRR